MRLLFLLILSLGSLNVSNVQVKLFGASQQRWKSNDASVSDSGYDYSISIVLSLPAESSIQIDTLWVKGNKIRAYGSNFISNVKNKTWDTVNVVAPLCYCKDSDGKMMKIQSATSPTRVKGEAVICLVINGKKQYIEIPRFSKLPDITR